MGIFCVHMTVVLVVMLVTFQKGKTLGGIYDTRRVMERVLQKFFQTGTVYDHYLRLLQHFTDQLRIQGDRQGTIILYFNRNRPHIHIIRADIAAHGGVKEESK